MSLSKDIKRSNLKECYKMFVETSSTLSLDFGNSESKIQKAINFIKSYSNPGFYRKNVILLYSRLIQEISIRKFKFTLLQNTNLQKFFKKNNILVVDEVKEILKVFNEVLEEPLHFILIFYIITKKLHLEWYFNNVLIGDLKQHEFLFKKIQKFSKF